MPAQNFFDFRSETAARTHSLLRFFLAVVLICAICLATYSYVSPEAQVFGHVYWKADTALKVVALSFDDGPNEPYTSAVLDVLDRYNVKATFFEIGLNAELYPDTIRRIVAEGHVLGNHSYSHNANHALFDSRADIRRAEEIFFEIAGVRPALYRPPHNKKSPWELVFLKELDLIPVTWSVGTGEGVGTDPQQAAAAIVSKAKPGAIIALHDGWGTNHSDIRAQKDLPSLALPYIIEALQNEGYSFATIPELLGLPAYK